MTAYGKGPSSLGGVAMWTVLAGLLGWGPHAAARQHGHHQDKGTETSPEAAAHGAKAPKEGLSAQAGLLEQGRTARAAKDYATARTALTEAYRQSPSLEVLFELGALAAAQGRQVAARDLMRRYLQDAPSEGDNENPKEAQRIVEQDSEPSGEVRILGTRGAVVLIDDQIVGMLPLQLPLLVPLGTHKITVELGSQRVEEQLKILSGQLAEMRVNQRTGVVVVSLPPAIILFPQGSGAVALQKLLAPALRPAVTKERHAVVTREQALAQAPTLAGCIDKLSCQLDLINQNEALYALRLNINGGPQRGPWQLELQLIDGGVAAVAATATTSCSDCTAEQAAAALAAAVGPLLQEAVSKPRGAVAVTSEPSAAEVYIAGEKVGLTPYRSGRFIGTYEVELQKAGYRPYKAPLSVFAGQTASLSAALTVLPEVEPPPADKIGPRKVADLGPGRRPVWRLATGLSLIGGGVLLGGFGISALAVEGQCDLEAPPDACPSRYHTRVPGAVMLGIGALFVVGGITLAAVPGPRRQTRAARAQVRLGGSGAPLGAGLRF